MPSIYEQAEILTALLVLGDLEIVPDHGGILDRALNRIYRDNKTASLLDLSFSTTSVGFRCFELPAIIRASIETGMMGWQSSDMRHLRLKLPVNFAQEIAYNYGPVAAFIDAGKVLAGAIEVENHVFG